MPRPAVALALFGFGVVALTARAEDGWTDLLKSGEGSPWKDVVKGWVFAPDCGLDPMNPRKLKAKEGEAKGVWVNGPGRLKDLITKESYGDCEVHVEFLIGKGSNSGIKFHALYEIQIYDSFENKAELTGNDCGGIYPKAENGPPYTYLDKGIPPKVNACKAPGEWQTLDATFRAARFNDKGEKIENAKIVKATLNGKMIHENQEMKTPTGSNYVKKELKTGPFMLQCDHGPVAFRNVKIRAVKE